MSIKNPNPIISGDKIRLQHQTAVRAVLGVAAPPVRSFGERFYNVDRWTARTLVKYLTEWAAANPGLAPTEDDIAEWVRKANLEPVPKREIVIASTPDDLDVVTASALTGGAYHEAFHTVYSCRRTLSVEEIAPWVMARWAKLPDWSGHLNNLLQLSNIVEDIKIERRGRVRFPGTGPRLADLHDFVLNQEKIMQGNAKETQILWMIFRDYGHGYRTALQEKIVDYLKAEHPQSLEYVIGNGPDAPGPLTRLLREAINLPVDDDLGSLRIAMDILIQLTLDSKQPDPANDPENQDHAPAEIRCPKCGADHTKLVIRPVKSGGHRIYCTVCGWNEEIQIQKGGKGDKGGKGVSIRFEPEKPEDMEDGEGASDKEEKGEKGEKDPTSAQGGRGGSGAHQIEGNDWSSLASEALAEGVGLKDRMQAMEEAVSAAMSQDDVQPGERAYRPYTTAQDKLVDVVPSKKGQDHDHEQAMWLYESVAEQSSFLRARLRQIMLAYRRTETHHGSKKGKILSGRMLVDNKMSLMEGRFPERPFVTRENRRELSMSAAVVLDQSGSMSGILRDVTRVLCAITEPLDNNGCPVQVTGFRDGAYSYYSSSNGDESAHRSHPVYHDVFKRFSEPLRIVKWRFANTRAEGGTPMADGIQVGLDSLTQRDEEHRVLFIITDGEPEPSHIPIITRQIRQARDRGIHVIGVGLGASSQCVTTLFPDHVWTDSVEDMPGELLSKISGIIESRL